MRVLHAMLLAPAVALALAASPAFAAAPLPTADEAQKLVAQAVNGRAVSTLVCTANKQNVESKSLIDYMRDLGFGRVTQDLTIFNLVSSGERFVSKEHDDWEKARLAVDPDKAAFAKMSAAPDGCHRIPLGMYTVATVSNVRAGDGGDQTAVADYTFTVAPTSFAGSMLKNNSKADPMVQSDALVAVPARPVFLSFYVDNAKKPFAAKANLAFSNGAWHVVP